MKDQYRKMYLQLSVDVLKQAIRQVKRAADSSTVLGEQLLITGSHGSGVSLAAYNGTFSIVRWIDEQPQGGALSQAVDAKMLADLVKTLPPGNFVDLTVHEKTEVSEDEEGQEHSFRKFWLDLESGSIEAQFNGYEEDAFPIALPDAPETGVRMKAGNLRQALEEVIFAASPNEYSHPTLAGVNFEFDADKLTLAAADGFRLARRVVDLELTTVEEPFSVLVPGQTLRSLLYLLRDVEEQEDDEVLFQVNDGGTQAQFLCGPDLLLTTQLIDGNFPDYQRIIPDLNTYPVTVTADRSALLKAVKRARIFSNLMVRFTCRADLDTKTLTIETEGAGAGNGETELSVDLAMPADTFSIAFNPKFFTQLLQAISTSTVTLAFKSAGRPGVVYPDGDDTWKRHIHVIMPMAN